MMTVSWWDWSWVLSITGITTMWLIGSGKKLGWFVGLGAQFLWLTYGIVTDQWGFILSAVVHFTVYTRNLLYWKKHNVSAQTDCKHEPSAS